MATVFTSDGAGSAVGEYFLALVQFAQNRPAEAEKNARDALSRNGSQAGAYILLAKIHQRQQDWYAVMGDARACLQNNPNGQLANEAQELFQLAQRQTSAFASSK